MLLCALHMLTTWCVHLFGAGLKQFIQQGIPHLIIYGVYKSVQSHSVPEMNLSLYGSAALKGMMRCLHASAAMSGELLKLRYFMMRYTLHFHEGGLCAQAIS